MTLDQENLIIDLYKQGYSYRELWEITKIPGGTISSFLSRKHKNLIILRELTRNRDRGIFIQKFCKEHDVPEYQARGVYDTMLERFCNKRQNTRSMGKEFNVSFADMVIPYLCPILGIKINYFSENSKADDHPSFDRVDNTKGYVAGNVEIVSWRGNRLKNDGTLTEHRKIVEYLETRTAGPREATRSEPIGI